MNDLQVLAAAALVGAIAIVLVSVAALSFWTGRLMIPGAARQRINRVDAPTAFSLSVAFLLLLGAGLAWWPGAILLFFIFPFS
jgi:hypothetical protein